MNKPFEPILTKSKWKASELDQKRIEFRGLVDGELREGVGTLWATECPGGLLSISIVMQLPGADGSTIQIRVPLTQFAVDRMEVHPDQGVASFRLLA